MFGPVRAQPNSVRGNSPDESLPSLDPIPRRRSVSACSECCRLARHKFSINWNNWGVAPRGFTGETPRIYRLLLMGSTGMGAAPATCPHSFARQSRAAKSAQNRPPQMNLFRLGNPPRAIARCRRAQSAESSRAEGSHSRSKIEPLPLVDSSGKLPASNAGRRWNQRKWMPHQTHIRTRSQHVRTCVYATQSAQKQLPEFRILYDPPRAHVHSSAPLSTLRLLPQLFDLSETHTARIRTVGMRRVLPTHASHVLARLPLKPGRRSTRIH